MIKIYRDSFFLEYQREMLMINFYVLFEAVDNFQWGSGDKFPFSEICEIFKLFSSYIFWNLKCVKVTLRP